MQVTINLETVDWTQVALIGYLVLSYIGMFIASVTILPSKVFDQPYDADAKVATGMLVLFSPVTIVVLIVGLIVFYLGTLSQAVYTRLHK